MKISDYLLLPGRRGPRFTDLYPLALFCLLAFLQGLYFVLIINTCTAYDVSALISLTLGIACSIFAGISALKRFHFSSLDASFIALGTMGLIIVNYPIPFLGISDNIRCGFTVLCSLFILPLFAQGMEAYFKSGRIP